MGSEIRLRETTSTAGTTARGGRREAGGATTAREPSMLPQWALDIVRSATHALSRVVWKIRFAGVEHIPPSSRGGLIIAANHQTYIDPFWVSLHVKRPTRYLAWNEAFDWPVVGRMLELLGSWPLQLEGSDPSAIRRSLLWLRRGGAVVIFPEGGRASDDGALMKFKAGAARMALEANVPILPVTIRGGQRVWPKGWRVPHPHPVEIIYHPLYTPAPLEGEDTRACARRATDDLKRIISTALGEEVSGICK
jgi:1-acyl-sn-glycerol-3-phosphate acyltransferase